MEQMQRAVDISWPPPTGVPYIVEDAFGSFVEVVMPGAYDGARFIAGERTFLVEEDEWDERDEDHTVRRIKRLGLVSER